MEDNSADTFDENYKKWQSTNVNGLSKYEISGLTIEDDFNLPGNYRVIQEFNFHNCVFKGSANIHYPDGLSSVLKFQNVVFAKNVEIKSHSALCEFDNCTFFGEFSFSGEVHLTLSNSSFGGDVQFKSPLNYVSINNCSVNGKNVKLNCNNVWMGSFIITDCNFQFVDFSESHFRDKLIVQKSKFYSSEVINFNKIEVGTLVFAESKFDCGCNFEKTAVNGKADFSGIKHTGIQWMDFYGMVFKGRVTFDWAKMKAADFSYCEFNETSSFKSVSISDLVLSKSHFEKGSDFLHSNIQSSDRETFRIIKNEFIKLNNHVEAQNYKAKEMIAYENELLKQKRFGDFFLLLLNKVSNLHGTSWVRGIAFTIIVAIGLYCCYLETLRKSVFNWGWKSWDSFIAASDITVKYFIKFFLVTHDIDFMEFYRPSAWSFVFDFLGRLFIGYGIYQTIQAFRKHGKG